MEDVEMYSQEYYLVFKKASNKYRALGPARISTKPVSLAAGEVALKLKVALPSTLFVRPQIQASITIPANNVTPPVVDAKTLNNVQEVLKSELGLDITVNLIEPKK